MDKYLSYLAVLLTIIGLAYLRKMLIFLWEKNRFYKVASELDLSLEKHSFFGFDRIVGGYRGFDVNIHLEIDSEKYRGYVTVVELFHKRDLDFEIKLSTEDFDATILKSIGFKDLNVGNSLFDDKFYIRAKDDAALSILSPEIQNYLLSADETPNILRDRIRLEYMGYGFGRDFLVSKLDFLCKLADLIKKS